MYSARPSLTARRALGPMNSARWRNGPPCRARGAARALDVQVDDLDVGELVRAGNERVEQHGWDGRGSVNVDILAGANARNSLLGRNELHGSSCSAVQALR